MSCVFPCLADKSEKKRKGNNETDVQKYFKYAQAEATELLLHFKYSPYATKKKKVKLMNLG